MIVITSSSSSSIIVIIIMISSSSSTPMIFAMVLEGVLADAREAAVLRVPLVQQPVLRVGAIKNV